MVQEKSVELTLVRPLALSIEGKQAENAADSIPEGRPGYLRSSLLAAGAGDGGIKIALLVIRVVCGNLHIVYQSRKELESESKKMSTTRPDLVVCFL